MNYQEVSSRVNACFFGCGVLHLVHINLLPSTLWTSIVWHLTQIASISVGSGRGGDFNSSAFLILSRMRFNQFILSENLK
jgi:hypothetical protein